MIICDPDSSIYGLNIDSYMDANTCLFWDVVDYPIPDGSDPVSMGEKIKSVLLAANYRGNVSIKAYVDTLSDELRGKYSDAGITVSPIPLGDANARVSPMVLDAYVWAMENPAPANVIVLSQNLGTSIFDAVGDFEFFYRFDFAVVITDPTSEWPPSDTDWLPPLEKSTSFLMHLFTKKRSVLD